MEPITFTPGRKSADGTTEWGTPVSGTPAGTVPQTPPVLSGFSSNPTPAATPLPTALAPQPVNAATYGVLRQMLTEFGLESLYETVAGFVRSDTSAAEMELILRDRPEVRQRFRAVFDREAQGLPPVSFAEVLNYEKQLSELRSFYGIKDDPGADLQSQAAELMVGDISLNELNSRLSLKQQYGRQLMADPANAPFVAQFVQQGGDEFDLVDALLNTDASLEDVEMRLRAASIGIESRNGRYAVDVEEALRLAEEGLDADAAAQGFGELDRLRGVIDGRFGGEDPIDRKTELAAITGDQWAIQQIERQKSLSAAAFSAGGSFAQDDSGFSGLR